MAEKRMFAKTIIDSDAFIDMPVTARLLYYDLSMRADDDGFVNSPKKIMRMIGASQDDLSILIMRKFILPFDNGVVVIKHWRIHNYIRKDTYQETPYRDEKAMLEVDENKAYRFKDTESRGRVVDETLTQIRLDKVREDKNSISVNYEAEFERLWERYPKKQGKKDALRHYITARKNGIGFEAISDGLDNYIAYIQASKTEMRYIKQGSTWFCQHCWDDEYKITQPTVKNKFNNFEQRGYSDADYEAIERMMV